MRCQKCNRVILLPKNFCPFCDIVTNRRIEKMKDKIRKYWWLIIVIASVAFNAALFLSEPLRDFWMRYLENLSIYLIMIGIPIVVFLYLITKTGEAWGNLFKEDKKDESE